MTKYKVSDSGDSRKYFTLIPNMIDDLDLSPFAVRLYLHFKRVAGDSGACWQSGQTLSEKCRMSVGSVSNAKNELVKAGLIEIEVTRELDGQVKNFGKPYHIIRIVDVWEKNIQQYQTSPHEVITSPHEHSSSPHEIKKNPINKNPNTRAENSGENDDMIKDSDSDVVKEHKQRIAAALERGRVNQSSKIDVSGFPEQYTEVIRVFCELWDFKPPLDKSQKSYWIEGAKQLQDACAEFGVDAIRAYHADYLRRPKDNGNSITIASPKSLVGFVRAKAAEMRSQSREVSQDIPPEVRGTKGKVIALDGRTYYDGVPYEEKDYWAEKRKKEENGRPTENITG